MRFFRPRRPTAMEQAAAATELARKEAGERRRLQRLAEIEALFAHVERLEPCPDPGCMAVRAAMARIMMDDDSEPLGLA